MDLKNFKKIGLSKSGKTTVFKHKDGHFLHVAHGALIPKHKKDMDALPCAEEGDIDDNGYDQGGTVPTPTPVTPRGISQGFKKATGFKEGGRVKLADGTPDGGLPSVEDAIQNPQPDMVGQDDNASAAQTGTGMGGVGASPAALDQDNYGQFTTPTPQSEVSPDSSVSSPAPRPASNGNPMRQWLDKDDAASAMDLAQGHIKPEDYKDLYGKKDTLGKISTIFGLLVGGAGAGMTHQPSALLGMMDKEIDRDLDAQKTSAANAQNFLRMAQQNPLVQQQARLTGANADQIAQTVALINQTNTTFHSLVSQVEQMPEATPQQVMKKQQASQSLQAAAHFIAPKISNAKDIASSFMQPINGAQQQAGGPTSPLLPPGANITGSQFNPNMEKDRPGVVDQFTNAQQVDKALQALPPAYEKMKEHANVIGRLSQVFGGLPYHIGDAARTIASLDPETRGYNSARTTLIEALVASKQYTQDQAQQLVDANAYVKGDPDELANEKLNNMSSALKRAAKTSLLENYGITKKQ